MRLLKFFSDVVYNTRIRNDFKSDPTKVLEDYGITNTTLQQHIIDRDYPEINEELSKEVEKMGGRIPNSEW